MKAVKKKPPKFFETFYDRINSFSDMFLRGRGREEYLATSLQEKSPTALTVKRFSTTKWILKEHYHHYSIRLINIFIFRYYIHISFLFIKRYYSQIITNFLAVIIPFIIVVNYKYVYFGTTKFYGSDGYYKRSNYNLLIKNTLNSHPPSKESCPSWKLDIIREYLDVISFTWKSR